MSSKIKKHKGGTTLNIPQADASNSFIPTLNKTGYMTTQLDPVSEAFVEYAANASDAVLEVGAAYGIATLAALARGARIFCNDLEPRHLALVQQQAAPQDRDRLTLAPGDFPSGVSLAENFFEAILMCRVLHLFNGDKIEASMRKAYQILKPRGKLFIVVDTVYLGIMADFIPEYERRVASGVQWPGFIENLQEYVKEKDLPERVHFLDQMALREVLEKASFTIEKIGFINRLDFPPDRRLDGRESIGIIARK